MPINKTEISLQVSKLVRKTYQNYKYFPPPPQKKKKNIEKNLRLGSLGPSTVTFIARL